MVGGDKRQGLSISGNGCDRYDCSDIVQRISISVLNPLADVLFPQDCSVRFCKNRLTFNLFFKLDDRTCFTGNCWQRF